MQIKQFTFVQIFFFFIVLLYVHLGFFAVYLIYHTIITEILQISHWFYEVFKVNHSSLKNSNELFANLRKVVPAQNLLHKTPSGTVVEHGL